MAPLYICNFSIFSDHLSLLRYLSHVRPRLHIASPADFCLCILLNSGRSENVVWIILAYVNNAEEVAIGVLKDEEIIIGFVGLGMTCSAKLKQPFHLTLLVVGIEVKV